jgi:hypothetical protein
LQEWQRALDAIHARGIGARRNERRDRRPYQLSSHGPCASDAGTKQISNKVKAEPRNASRIGDAPKVAFAPDGLHGWAVGTHGVESELRVVRVAMTRTSTKLAHGAGFRLPTPCYAATAGERARRSFFLQVGAMNFIEKSAITTKAYWFRVYRSHPTFAQ